MPLVVMKKQRVDQYHRPSAHHQHQQQESAFRAISSSQTYQHHSSNHSRHQRLKLTSLPSEVLSKIAGKLRHSDMISLSQVNKELRRLLIPYVFSQLSIKWTQLPELKAGLRTRSSFLARISRYPRSLIITENDPWAEEHLIKDLTTVLQACPSISHLKIPCSNTSNWLTKIQQIQGGGSIKNIRSLTFISIFEENPQRLKMKLDSKSHFSLPHFDIAHLEGFTRLRVLSLKGFEITRHHSSPQHAKDSMIDLLKLTNCTWAYPNEVSDFGPITSLQLIYSEKYKMLTLSERYSVLIKSPPSNLKYFTVRIIEQIDGKMIEHVSRPRIR